MNYSMLFIGLFLVAPGFLVRRYPILISGYNTMSAKEKENVDIKGLSAFMCRCLVVMGVTLSGSYYFCVWMQWWTDSCIRTGVRSADFCCICAGKGTEV